MAIVIDANARKAVELAIKRMDGIHGVDARSFILTPLARTPSGSWTIRAQSPDRSRDHVYRMIGRDDLAPGMLSYPLSFHAEHVADQEAGHSVGSFRIIRRPYLARLFTVSDLIRESTRFDNDRHHTGQYTRAFLSQALDALISIHEAGYVHGDIRPEKFGFTKDGRLVLRDVGVRFNEEFKDPEFVAPELLDSNVPNYTPSSDVFAFLRIALKLLRPFHGDRADPELANLVARIAWLADYFFPHPIRPSARELKSVLLMGEVNLKSTIDPFLDSYNDARRRALPLLRSKSPSLTDLKRLLNHYPETKFALHGSTSGERLAAWFALANDERLRYSRFIERALPAIFDNGRSRNPRDFENGGLPTDIDSLWANSIHRMLFGFPIDPEHDKRLARMVPEELSERTLFLHALEGASKARAALLEENSFFSTREVLGLLSTAKSAPLEREDLLAFRRWGYVLTVPDHGRWLYPEFQFDRGVVSPLIERVHDRLRTLRRGMDASPWVELTFWSMKRDHLGGVALKDALWQERLRHQVADVIRDAVI